MNTWVRAILWGTVLAGVCLGGCGGDEDEDSGSSGTNGAPTQPGDPPDRPPAGAAAGGSSPRLALLHRKRALLEADPEEMAQELRYAAADGDVPAVRLLLETGADPGSEGIAGWAPLHWAAVDGHVAVAEALLDAAKDQAPYLLQAGDRHGSTPLHLAAQQGHKTMAALLLDRGAPINERRSDSRTPLHVAAAEGHESVVALLLKRGAALKRKDAQGRTAAELATRPSAGQAVRRLLADADARLAARPDVQAITQTIDGYVKAFAAGDRKGVEGHSLPIHAERLPRQLTPFEVEWQVQDVDFAKDAGWGTLRITPRKGQPPYQFRFDLRRTPDGWRVADTLGTVR